MEQTKNNGLLVLDNISDLDSLMSTFTQALYNTTICDEIPLKKIFKKIALTKLEHLLIFMELAKKLEMDPRLWTCRDDHCCYWSPAYLNYPTDLPTILDDTIKKQKQLLAKYYYQMTANTNLEIKAALKKIIEDDTYHLQLLSQGKTKFLRN